MEQGPPGTNNGYRLFVGNMGSRMTEAELRAMVEPIGPVMRIHVVRDGFTGSSCGYAFVEMAEGATAARAVSELNGKRIDGHFLVVRPLF